MRYFLLSFVFLFGCGKFDEKFGRNSPEHTGVRFSVDGQSGNLTTLLPGIMIYAVRADNPQSRSSLFLDNETIRVDWLVPNGVYNFFGVAYGTANLSGTMYCGRATQIPLNGERITVPIDLRSTGQCGTAPFSPPGFNQAPNPDQPRLLHVGFCAPTGGDMNGLDSGANDCDGLSTNPAGGSAARVKIALIEYTNWNSGTPAVGTRIGQMTSGCMGAGFSGSASDTTKRVPYGEPFVVEIEAYSDAGCTTSIGAYAMTSGVVNAAANSTVRFRNASDNLVFPSLQMMKPISAAVNAFLFIRNY